MSNTEQMLHSWHPCRRKRKFGVALANAYDERRAGWGSVKALGAEHMMDSHLIETCVVSIPFNLEEVIQDEGRLKGLRSSTLGGH